MKYLANQESHVNVSISVELLAQLIATGKLCAADLTALDTESQQRLRALMLSVCAATQRIRSLMSAVRFTESLPAIGKRAHSRKTAFS